MTDVEPIEIISFNSKNMKVLLFNDGLKTKGCFVLLRKNAHFLLHGVAQFVHLYGPNLSVMGASISSQSFEKHTIYSPNCNPSVSFYHCNDYIIQDGVLLNKLNNFIESNFDSCFVSIIISKLSEEFCSFENFVSILIFLPLKSRFIDSLCKIKKYKRLFEVSTESCVITDLQLVSKLGFNFQEHDGMLGYKVSSDMLLSINKIIGICDSQNAILKSGVTLICGPKGVGKSSFLRFLINGLLTNSLCSSVAVLDCDLGQPEFTLPGLVSLCLVYKPVFGPPFTHFSSFLVVR